MYFGLFVNGTLTVASSIEPMTMKMLKATVTLFIGMNTF